MVTLGEIRDRYVVKTDQPDKTLNGTESGSLNFFAEKIVLFGTHQAINLETHIKLYFVGVCSGT